MKKWLDNYGKKENANEGHSSAPKEWIGEGYSNVGRNYSPAWGGQFEEGGSLSDSGPGDGKFPFPIYSQPTRSDSLFLLNNNKIIKKLLDSGKYEWLKDKYGKGAEKIDPKKWKERFENRKNFFDSGIPYEIKEGTKKKGKLSDYKQQKGKFIGTSDWVSGGGDDYGFPMQYIHPDIAPQYEGDLAPKDGDRDKNPFVYSFGYDELAITPWDMLTPQQQKDRLKKYGTSGTPYTEPEEPSLKKKVTKMEPIPSKGKSTTPQLRTIEQPNIEMPAVQRGQYRTSYYDPQMKDWNERAFMTQKESDQFADEMSKRGLPGSYGNVTQRVQYQLGGNVYPVNYVPEAAMGGSIPGSVGFTYARTNSPAPSNGPYAKKTKASAQYGRAVADETHLPKPKILPRKPGVDSGFRAPYEPEQYVNYPFRHYETLPEVVVHSKTKNKYKNLPNVIISSKKKSPTIKQAVESSAIQMYNPSTGETISTANPGQTKRQIKELTSHIKGDMSSVDALKKVTAVTQFIPIPWIKYPSLAINSALGAADAYDANKRGDKVNENINTAGLLPWKLMLPGVEGVIAEGVNATADLTDNFGLEKKKNGGMTFYQHGLDWRPKTISKDGSVIKDDRGQWAHPGEITEIGSNRITMQGVPYPVLGISDTGHTQMMFPGEEYKFKGKKVTEFPMAQNGYQQPTSSDSLALYNNTMALLNYYGNKKKYKDQGISPVSYDITSSNVKAMKDMKERLKDPKQHPFTARRWNSNLNVAGNLMSGLFGGDVETDQLDPDYDFKMSDYYQRINPYQYRQRELANFKIDTDAPMSLYDTRIKPTRQYSYENVDNRYGPIGGTNPLLGDMVNFYGYDPALIKPWSMLTDKEKALRLGKPNQSSTVAQKPKPKPGQWKPTKPFTGVIEPPEHILNTIHYDNNPNEYNKKYPPIYVTDPKDPTIGMYTPEGNKILLKEEQPKLKRKPVKMETIKSKSSTTTPGIKTMSGTPVKELPVPKRGEYRVSYYNPDIKDWSEQAFETEKESDKFADEMSKRGYGGSYGNVTQTRKVSKKETGGWLNQYK